MEEKLQQLEVYFCGGPGDREISNVGSRHKEQFHRQQELVLFISLVYSLIYFSKVRRIFTSPERQSSLEHGLERVEQSGGD